MLLTLFCSEAEESVMFKYQGEKKKTPLELRNEGKNKRYLLNTIFNENLHRIFITKWL